MPRAVKIDTEWVKKKALVTIKQIENGELTTAQGLERHNRREQYSGGKTSVRAFISNREMLSRWRCKEAPEVN